MRTRFSGHFEQTRRCGKDCVAVAEGRVAVAKNASPWQRDASLWQKQSLNKLDTSSMETRRIREPQGPHTFFQLFSVTSHT